MSRKFPPEAVNGQQDDKDEHEGQDQRGGQHMSTLVGGVPLAQDTIKIKN